MLESLRILYLNVGKRRQVQHSLLNDDKAAEYSVIATVEPYIHRDPLTDQPTVTPAANWEIIQPTLRREDRPERHSFRALLWVNRRIRARAYSIPSYDIVAAELITARGPTLVCAAYDPRSGVDAATRESRRYENDYR